MPKFLLIRRVYTGLAFVFLLTILAGLVLTPRIHASTLLNDHFTSDLSANWNLYTAGTGSSITQDTTGVGTVAVKGDGVKWDNAAIYSKTNYAVNDNIVLESTTKITSSSYGTALGYGNYQFDHASEGHNAYVIDYMSGGFSLFRYVNGTITQSINTTRSYSADTWYKIQMVFSSSTSKVTFRVYENGTGGDLLAALPNSLDYMTPNIGNQPVFVSAYSNTTKYLTIDSIGVKNTAQPDYPSNIQSLVSNTKSYIYWDEPLDTGSSSLRDYTLKYRIKNPPGEWIIVGGITDKFLAVDGLLNDTQYDVQLYAYNTNNVASLPYDFTITPTDVISIAGKPYGENIVANNSYHYLSWTAPTYNGSNEITDYKVEYKENMSNDWLVYNDDVTASTFVTMNGLVAGTTYDFRIKAINAQGDSLASDTVSTTIPYHITDEFNGLNIDNAKWVEHDTGANVNQNNGVVTITGDGSTFYGNGLETSATISRGNSLTVESILKSSNSITVALGYGDIDWTNSNKSAYVLNLQGGKFILWKSVNGDYASSSRDTGVSYVPNRWYKVRMLVGDTAGVTFQVYQDIDGNKDFAAEGETTDLLASANYNGYVDGNFDNKKVFFSTYSSTGTTLTVDSINISGSKQFPDAPTGLVASAANGRLRATWTAPFSNGSSVTDYIVQYRQWGADRWLEYNDGESTTTSTRLTGLSNETNYELRVAAKNSNGVGSFSGIANATPREVDAAAPVATNISVSSTTSLVGSYTFLDSNLDLESASTFRWLRSDTSFGIYSAINGATSTTYSPTEGDIGKYVKFEVTPVADAAPANGNAFSSPAFLVSEENIYLYHILSTGQSLSIGYNGAPALSTTQPFHNLKLDGPIANEGPLVYGVEQGTNLIDLIENTQESMSSSLANTLTNLIFGNSHRFIVTKHGRGSADYASLKKGTTQYNRGMTQVINAKAAAEAMGKLYKVIGVTSIHGESNHVEGTTAAAYESYLNEWQNDYETDVKFITGQTQNIPLFIDQMSSWTGYNTATSVIPSAQLSASENNTKINLVGPKYFLDYADEAHLISNSYRLLGEYYAKAIKKVVFDHESWVPLSPKSIVRKDNIIYAQFNVPAGPLTIDTTNVLEKENYGFEYWDDSGNPVSINSVEILDDNKVKITLSSVPTGNNQKLRYAYTGTSGSAPGAMVEGSARGNIRDNDSTPSLYGDNLYNWLVHFDKSINNDTAGPVISDIKDDKSNNNAVALSWSTNEESSTQIEYGLSDSDTINTAEEDTVNFTTSHSVNMSNLAACSVFKYRVKSKDLAQNQTVSGFQYFTTPGCAGDSDISSFKSLKITNASGGSIGLFDSDNNGLSLTIPNEFSGQDAHFQIKKLLKNSVLGAIGTPNGKDLVGDEIYDLKALSDAFTSITNFAKPIRINISYSLADLGNLDESSLKIYRWDGSSWNVLSGCLVNSSSHSLSCSTSAFSTFGLFGNLLSSKAFGGGGGGTGKSSKGFIEQIISSVRGENGKSIDKSSNELNNPSNSISSTKESQVVKELNRIKFINLLVILLLLAIAGGYWLFRYNLGKR